MPPSMLRSLMMMRRSTHGALLLPFACSRVVALASMHTMTMMNRWEPRSCDNVFDSWITKFASCGATPNASGTRPTIRCVLARGALNTRGYLASEHLIHQSLPPLPSFAFLSKLLSAVEGPKCSLDKVEERPLPSSPLLSPPLSCRVVLYHAVLRLRRSRLLGIHAERKNQRQQGEDQAKQAAAVAGGECGGGE